MLTINSTILLFGKQNMAEFTLLDDAASLINSGIKKLAGKLGIDTVPFNGGADSNSNKFKQDVTVTTGSVQAGETTNAVDVESEDINASVAAPYDIIYYPEGLLAEGKLGNRFPHAIAIFMNVNSASKLGKFMTDNPSYEAKVRLDATTLDIGQNTAGQGVAGGARTSTYLDKLGAAKFKRFTGCIMLPLPLNISAEYAAKYGDVGAGGVLGTALKMGVNGSTLGAGVLGAPVELLGGYLRDLAKLGASNVAGMLKSGDLGEIKNPNAMFDKIAGTIRNPRTEQVFDHITLRKWDFTWQINISSVKEWNTVRTIAALLKENMHPELDYTPAGTFMVMPNEFDLEFYEKGGAGFAESKTLPKIATSALIGLRVNYTPNGHWIAFEGTMIPPFATIDATFAEMEPLHRGMVRDVAKRDTLFTASNSLYKDVRKGF